MNDNTQENVFIFDAPDELWSDINECVAKVVLTGKGANFLPPDVFKKLSVTMVLLNTVK